MLGALRYFEEHKGSFRSEFSTPKGAGSTTVYHLESYGFLERQGRMLRITPAGLSILKDGTALRTITKLRDSDRAERIAWATRSISTWTGAAQSIPIATVSSTAPSVPVAPVAPVVEKAPLLATQEQILAVYRAAQQAGLHVEVRIEGGAIRFIPCEAPLPRPCPA